MSKRKLFITDLDGTFVKDSVNIKEVDKKVMRDIQEEMAIGIATGRSLKEIEYIEEKSGINFHYQIGFNGAQVKVGDQLIYDQKIPKELLGRMLDYIEEHQLTFDLLTGKERIGNHQPEDTSRLWNLEIIHPKEVDKDLGDYPIYKINLRPNPDELNLLVEDLEAKFPELSICKSGEERVEVTAKNITKGKALQLLRETEDYHIIAIGDSGNDVAMFQESDLSVCMADADEEIKKYASHIVQDFHQVGELL